MKCGSMFYLRFFEETDTFQCELEKGHEGDHKVERVSKGYDWVVNWTTPDERIGKCYYCKHEIPQKDFQDDGGVATSDFRYIRCEKCRKKEHNKWEVKEEE